VSTRSAPTTAPPEQWPALYQPSETIGRSRHLTVLSSPDSAGELADFSAAELDRGGWTTPHATTISIKDMGIGSAGSIGSY